ncbi:Flagellar hook-length control protein FliK [Alloactinosynnema sp. L-07]|uniref:S8 family serine peptidase n=1 Tax=Alloactinosynnema sp. L-07 TaxID=1653480 RepID=UPI00065F0012|nr:S8 family serine peptidase [Alloactinosynnema sp. L-07]CRK54989.1 Flagellar hook-length control protein FliK [Alloactinosynnema sp. L-07]
MTTLLVIPRSAEDLDTLRETETTVLARYPHAVLVDATDAQVADLEQRGLQTAELPAQAVRATGNEFDFADAQAAEERAPTPTDPGRTGYYLVRLAGPAAAAWLTWLTQHGVTVLDSLEDLTLLVSALPDAAHRLRAQPWAAGVTPYRAAMCVAPALRGGGRRLDHAALAEPGGYRAAQVEVAVFPAEDLAPVVAVVEAAGGSVLSAEAGVVVASAPAAAITELAELPGVRSIEPHTRVVAHNDQARKVMRVPSDNTFDTTVLTGSGQIVAIADSGIDTGVPETMHPDLRGRVAGITSWPTKADYRRFTTDEPEHDDGPGDPDSGHGTHVAGSVLGNGRAARTVGGDTVPSGVAPKARVFFQSIGQKVAWKTAEQLAAEGIRPFEDEWPPNAVGLYGLPLNLQPLFEQAYQAGARIHTNSWGSPADGAYTTTAQVVDKFIWDHQDMLILFSAGNAGVDANGDGVVDQDTISAPGTAKNCLTVGASENVRPAGSQPPPGRNKRWDELKDKDGNLRYPAFGPAGHLSDNPDGLAAFSSRGPADDQRIKPDVVAPGTNVLSTLSTVIPQSIDPLWGRLPAGHPLRPFYCWSGGTSMSTPLVAGAVAVVRQHLVEQRRHHPSAALLKAMLIHGATPLPGQFPGEVSGAAATAAGFGRVDVARCLTTVSGKPVCFADSPDDAVQTGEFRVLRIDGMTAGEPLRVTLVWTDAPSGSGGGLVNQLYLRVVDPEGKALDGDVSRFPDPVNNVQQVTVPDALPGVYRIAVFGFSVIMPAPGVPVGPVARQNFALAVSNGTSLTKLQ